MDRRGDQLQTQGVSRWLHRSSWKSNQLFAWIKMKKADPGNEIGFFRAIGEPCA
jgi:hypothetical protein